MMTIFICYYFRFRRLKSLLLKYKHVQLLSGALYGTPYMTVMSFEFVLIRTYDIPTNQWAQLNRAGHGAEDSDLFDTLS